MKRLLSITLILLAVLSAVSCKKPEKRGPTEVDYGEVAYVLYSEGGPVTFEYLDCFKPTEMDEEQLVTYTPDGNGVLTFLVYDPSLDEISQSDPSYEKPNKNFAEISAMTDEEAENFIRVALGMVGSQGAEYTVDAFSFERGGDVLKLSMEATAVYGSTGEIQKLWMVKFVLADDHAYTLRAFAPASIVTKYGPAFRNVAFAGPETEEP